MTQLSVASFYRFTAIDDPAAFAARFEVWCVDANLKGSLLVAHEGVNGSLCGIRAELDFVLERLRSLPGFSALCATIVPMPGDAPPFRRLRVRVRAEIVTFGEDRDAHAPGGTAVDPGTWHLLLDDPLVRVVDVRNAYETMLGGFPGAIDPHTQNFTEFRAFARDELAKDRDAPIAMYCTGGIRCAKAGAWLISQGFKQVYELKNGVLGYLQTVAAEQNRWQGNCFVFDERVSVDRQLLPGGERLCNDCGLPWRPCDRDADQRQCDACRSVA